MHTEHITIVCWSSSIYLGYCTLLRTYSNMGSVVALTLTALLSTISTKNILTRWLGLKATTHPKRIRTVVDLTILFSGYSEQNVDLFHFEKFKINLNHDYNYFTGHSKWYNEPVLNSLHLFHTVHARSEVICSATFSSERVLPICTCS